MKKLPREIWLIILEMKTAAVKREMFQKSKTFLERELEFPIMNSHEFRYNSEIWYYKAGCHGWFVSEYIDLVTKGHFFLKN